jgi:hypothetical protein
MTSKNFEATSQFQSWDEMSGKVKPVEAGGEGEPNINQAGAARSTRANATPLEGAYHLLKPLPVTADDHPKKPIWNAVVENNGGTIEQAKAACPAENPKRKTNGVYTFSSEFRYFLKAGYAAMGPIPEGFDYSTVVKPVKEVVAKEPKEPEAPKEPKAKKEKKSEGHAAADAGASQEHSES